MIDSKTEDLANTDERAAAAREELDDANDALAADTEFLGKVQDQCKFHDADYAQRLATRREELAAITGALEVITHDDAKDTFTKTLGHTRRGEKMGSRDLKEYKEERKSES